jgi:hypothetical protein
VITRNSASIISTGGGGYTFADRVAAGFLAQMLKRKFPFEAHLGVIIELHFETRDAGHVLDDLQLVLKRGQDLTRSMVSVKSNRQLTKNGFNSEFVRDAWEQWRGGDGSNFDAAKDVLGLIVGIIDEPTLQEWLKLQKQAASTTPDHLVARLQNKNQSSATQRRIFEGLRKSANGNVDPVETARLVSRVRVLRFSDAMEGDYINLCAEIVRAGSLEEGARLWSRLLQLASENRATGGHFDLPKLIGVLRVGFDLQDHPDYRNDWSRIESVTQENIKAVRSVIGSGIRLTRAEEQERLTSEVKANNVVVIAGESGSGKSAAVSQLVSPGANFQRTIWFSAHQLSKASQAELANAFNLDHDIPLVIKNSGLRDCALVFDGFERFEGEARARAIELMRVLQEGEFVGSKVVLTCQPQSLKWTIDALAEAGISDVHKVDFDKPKLQEIFDAVASMPGMRSLLMRAELQPILRNLMVLDWILREDVALLFSETRPWIGETELIDCIWERWVGRDSMKHARGALLRTLGQREGDRLSGAVHMHSIPATELPLLGELEQAGLIRVSGPSVQFAHDLMGDWARYRVLKFEENDAPHRIKTLAQIPRWGRAIRLFGQSLAESGIGLDKWKRVNSELSGADSESRIASDLFLDSLLFAANSEYLLEHLWPDLVADEGQILSRLLNRLVHVASIPDWRFNAIEPKLAEQFESWFRIPQPLYWIPVLRVLSRHSADVSEYALIQGSEVCGLWLRTMPVQIPGRREAGLLALELAKEGQGLIAEGMIFRDKDSVIYEAVLLAAPEFPDEVTQVALEVCRRRDEPAHATQRRTEKEERQTKLREEWQKKNPEKDRSSRYPIPGGISYSEGSIRDPAADGPLRRVPGGFQLAVMNTVALNGLISVRPETAREVLLAVCIEEPKRWDRHRNDRALLLDRLGLTDWHGGYPAAYWKGPFLKFLQEAPEQGLDAIVRLVNYATERWLETGLGPNATEVDPKDYGLEFEVGEERILWVGDGNVYAWNRYLSMDGDSVQCALMALESWLYQELEQGRSIEKWIDYIFERGMSLAFAGVLVSVGLRFQGLFLNGLQPLLGNFYLYQIQMSLALQEQSGTWKISWAKQPEMAVRLASEWHDKPHRRILLRDIASTFMLQDEGTKEYLTTRKAEWAKLPQTEKGKLDMEFFLARFDPANYTETPQDDGRILVTMKWPPHLQKIADQSQEENALRMLALSLAQRARRLLERQVTMGPEDLESFAKQVQLLANWKDARSGEEQEQYRINSLAGGLAVLVILHRDWLSQHAELEAWSFDTLRNLKPIWPEHSSPVSISDHGAEVFLGETAVALLQESSEEWVLRLAFSGVTGWEYNSTLFTVWRAYLLLDKLGDRFGELLNVVVMWSALRRAAIRESGYYGDASQLAKYRDLLFQRYLAGKLKGALIPLRRVEKLGRRLVERIERRSMSDWEKRSRELAREQRDHKIYREMPDLDLQIIQKGFGFTAGMIRYPVDAENKLLQEYIRELFDLEMRSLPRADAADERTEIEGTPYEYDIWVMERVAEYVARTNSVETARQFFRPILDLGPAARYWVEDFLQSWISRGLQVTSDVAGFSRIWQDMLQYAETLAGWQPGEGNYWSRAEGLAAHLIGLSDQSITVLGDPKYKGLITSMSGAFERWCSRWLKYSSAANWFAYFLRTESGSVLRLQGIKQLAATVEQLPDRDWHRNDLGALFTEVLALSWKDQQAEIERDATLKQAFLSLLAVLCGRQIPEALHLRAKVSQVLSLE